MRKAPLVCLDLDGTSLTAAGAVPVSEFLALSARVDVSGGRLAVLTARPLLDVARLFAWHDAALDVWASDGAVFGTVRAGRSTVHEEFSLKAEFAAQCWGTLFPFVSSVDLLAFGTSDSGFAIAHTGVVGHAKALLAEVDGIRPTTEMQPENVLEFIKSRPVRAVSALGSDAAIQALHECLPQPLPGTQVHDYRETRVARGLSWLDVSAVGATKGAATDFLRARYQASIVIAAGNEANDESMFAAADITVAPADACRSILTGADVVVSERGAPVLRELLRLVS